MQPVVVAFSEHPHATEALKWGSDLASALDAPLRVISVFEPTYAEIAPDWYDELLAARRDLVASSLAELGRDHVEPTVVESSDPMNAVAEYLDREGASICVVGSGGSLGPAGLGSSPGIALLHHTGVPVAAIPTGTDRLTGDSTIVVGVDGSPSNVAALQAGERIAVAVGASVTAVLVDEKGELTPDIEQSARAEVAKLQTAPTRFETVAGHPTETLLSRADELDAAAIVVGTRGGGGFLGLRLGRVPHQLVAHAERPVIVVPG